VALSFVQMIALPASGRGGEVNAKHAKNPSPSPPRAGRATISECQRLLGKSEAPQNSSRGARFKRFVEQYTDKQSSAPFLHSFPGNPGSLRFILARAPALNSSHTDPLTLPPIVRSPGLVFEPFRHAVPSRTRLSGAMRPYKPPARGPGRYVRNSGGYDFAEVAMLARRMQSTADHSTMLARSRLADLLIQQSIRKSPALCDDGNWSHLMQVPRQMATAEDGAAMSGVDIDHSPIVLVFALP